METPNTALKQPPKTDTNGTEHAPHCELLHNQGPPFSSRVHRCPQCAAVTLNPTPEAP